MKEGREGEECLPLKHHLLPPRREVWLSLCQWLRLVNPTNTKVTKCWRFMHLLLTKFEGCTLYLLTEWGGQTAKYLAWDHGVQTKRSEVCAPWLSAKYFPIRLNLTQSISILSYDHCTFPFFFLVIKFAIGMFTCVTHFDQKVGIYITTKLFQFASCKEPYAILAVPDSLFPPCLCSFKHGPRKQG